MNDDSGDRIPPSSDPRWAEWSKPLAKFLAEPRPWPEIKKWARDKGIGIGMVQQQLAWLSLKRLAGTVGPGVWKSVSDGPVEVVARDGLETLEERALARHPVDTSVAGGGSISFWTHVARHGTENSDD